MPTIKFLLSGSLSLLLGVSGCYAPNLPSGKFGCSVDDTCPTNAPVCIALSGKPEARCVEASPARLCWKSVMDCASGCRTGSCLTTCTGQIPDGPARTAFQDFLSCAQPVCQAAGKPCASGSTDSQGCFECIVATGAYANAELDVTAGPCAAQVTACKAN